MNSRILTPALSCLAAALLLTSTVLAGTTRVSISSMGVQANYNTGGGISVPSLSADGRYVAFESGATNLVPGPDANGQAFDVFVHDRKTLQTTLVSVSSAGVQGNEQSFSPSISADGRFVAFASSATNLVPGDTNAFRDVFVHDRETGQTIRISMGSAGVQGDNDSDWPAISSDGSFVAFQTRAFSLGGTSGNDVLVHDLVTGQNNLVSVNSAGEPADLESYYPSISGDGRLVTFTSRATNLDPCSCLGFSYRIYMHDRLTGLTTQVDAGANNQAGFSSISADGRYVAFDSNASNLVPGDTNSSTDVFVRDLQTGTFERVSVDSAGQQANVIDLLAGLRPSISADGRHVAFLNLASNLVSDDTNAIADVFVHDRQTGQTSRASVSSAGVQGYIGSFYASISADGHHVALYSGSDNLVCGDWNQVRDVFVHDDDFDPWACLGYDLASSLYGSPLLVGLGTLAAGSTGELVLDKAKPSAFAILFVSLASTPSPFKGGTLVTVPVALVLSVATDASGGVTLPFVWPAGIPSGISFYFQWAIQDAAGPQGASLSNALIATTP